MAAPSWRRILLDALLIVVLALVVRAVYLAGYADDPLARTLTTNAMQYDEQARYVLEGHRQPVTSGFQPLYVYAVAGAYGVFGPSPAAVRWCQVLLAALTAGLLTVMGGTAGRRKGLAAGLLWCAFWPGVLYAGELLPDTLITFLVVAAATAATVALRSGRPLWWGASALALGLAVVGKPNALLLAIWAPLAAWVHPGVEPAARRRQLLASLTLPLAAAVAVVAAPALVEGDRSSTQAFAAKTLWDGNHAESDGINPFQAEFPETLEWEVWEDPDDTAAIADAFLDEVRRHAREAPGSFAALQGRKLWTYLSTWEVANNLSPRWRRARSSVLAAPLWLGFGALVALSLAGLVVAGPRWREHLVPLGWTLTWSASIVAILIAGRYRLPAAALLCVVGGLGAVALIDAVRQQETRRLAVLLACLALGAAISTLDPFELRHHAIGTVLDAEAKVLHRAGDAVGAEERYRAGLDLPRGTVELHRGLGLLLIEQGRPGEGLAALATAVERAPLQADLHGDLGASLRDLGRPDEALAPLQRAVELDPTQASFHYNLGLALADLGRLAEAEQALGGAIDGGYEGSQVWMMRGSVRAKLGRWSEAEGDLRRAAELDPGDCQIRVMLGAVLMEQERYGPAAAELERCLEQPLAGELLQDLRAREEQADPADQRM